jgi:hypothetical protein
MIHEVVGIEFGLRLHSSYLGLVEHWLAQRYIDAPSCKFLSKLIQFNTVRCETGATASTLRQIL